MMAALRRGAAAVRRWLGGDAHDRQIDAELQSILEHDIDARVEAGLPPHEARRAAMAGFGGVTQVREEVREARAGAWIDDLVRDTRHAARALRDGPGLSIAVVGSLAIGMTVMVGSVAFVNAWLFGSLPGVRDEHELFAIDLRRLPDGQNPGYLMRADADYRALRVGLADIADITATASRNVTIDVVGPRQVGALLVSANYFDVLGTPPMLGRGFGPREEQSANADVVVISDNLWRRDFAADPAILGRTLRVAQAVVEIVGVAPPRFGGINVRLGQPRPDLWFPLGMANRIAPESTALPGRGLAPQIHARARAGIGPAQIEASSKAVASGRIREDGFAANQYGGANISSVGLFQSRNRNAALAILMVIPVLVLVIACINAGNLMLARGSRRRRELAIRLAIGAGRWRVVRHIVLECFLLALVAAGVALLAVWWGLEIASSQFNLEMTIDAVVLLTACGVAVFSTIVCGVIPSLRVTTRAPFGSLGATRTSGEATPTSARGSRWLVMAQVALSAGVLATATQLVALVKAEGGSAGIDGDQILMASFDLDQLAFAPDEAASFYRRLLDEASRMLDVEAAGLARVNAVWTFGRGKGPGSLIVWKDGDVPGRGEVVVGGVAGGELFRALGVSVVKGRNFGPADREGPPRVAVVNRVYEDSMPGRHALGSVVRVYPWNQNDRKTDDKTFAAGRDVEIVGVIDAVREPRYSQGDISKIYLPSPLQPEPALALYLTTRRPADDVVPALAAVVRAIDSRVPIIQAGSLTSFNQRSMGPEAHLPRAAEMMGVIALALAAAGLLAVVSYLVGVRLPEFALRMALGARPGGVVALIIGGAMRMVFIGLAIGLVLAFVITQLVRSSEFGASGLDYLAFLGTGGLLVAVMIVASIWPALRAARADPGSLLKAL